MNKNLLDYVELLANEKSVDKELVLMALESAIASAVKKSEFPGEDADIAVKVDPKTGDYQVWRQWLVVPDDQGLQEPDRQILQWEAKEDYSDQGEMNVGDYVRQELKDYSVTGRRFATDARQVILQKLREAERTKNLEEFKNLYKDQKIVHGQIRKNVGGDWIVEIGKIEARLPKSECIPHELLRTNDRIRAYVSKIDPASRQQQVILSRACNEFLIELLKLEVPEINEGLLEIKNVAREPGQRAKIAVQVKDKRIDPIGTCVGVKGSRVQNVTKELNNERIDIVRWSDQPVEYVVSALAPATVTYVVVHADAGKMDVVVDQENKKGAVGASGQNVKLASKLTGWDINVMTAEEAAEEKEKEIGEIRSKLMQYLEVDEEVAEALIENGIDTLENLAYGPEDELFAMEDFDEDTIRELRSRARTGLITQALEREELLKTADPKLLELPGMDHDLVAQLSKKGVKTLDDLADLSTAELVEMTNMEEQDAQKLIVAARAHWDN